mmetsp:Transcript_58740/g.119563  ORF Transcript_58740/g.119563 Transcript_58740/m.119563 type:complete len:343 (-) Transcript_58740:1687-2715(-)
MLEGTNAELASEVHLQANGSIHSRLVDLTPSTTFGQVFPLQDPSQGLNAFLLCVDEGQGRLAQVGPSTGTCPANLGVLDQLPRVHHVQGILRKGWDGLWPTAGRNTCGPAEVDAQFPPSRQTRQQHRSEVFGKGPLPIQDELRLLEGSLAKWNLPQGRDVPQRLLLQVATWRQPAQLHAAQLRAQNANATSVVLPDLLQPLLGPEHQGIEALLALEGHLNAYHITIVSHGALGKKLRQVDLQFLLFAFSSTAETNPSLRECGRVNATESSGRLGAIETQVQIDVARRLQILKICFGTRLELLCIDPEKPIAALFGDAGAIEAYHGTQTTHEVEHQWLLSLED